MDFSGCIYAPKDKTTHLPCRCQREKMAPRHLLWLTSGYYGIPVFLVRLRTYSVSFMVETSRSPLALNGYRPSPQRHGAYGGLTEASIIPLPTRYSEEPKKWMILATNSPAAAAAASARRGCCSSPRSGDGIHDILISGQVFVDPILGIIR